MNDDREQLTGRTWLGRQSMDYVATWAMHGEAVRIRIRRDFYDFQSFAVAELFDPEGRKWNRVASLPFSQMASLALRSNRLPDANEDEHEVTFYADQVELLDEVALILASSRVTV